MIGIEFEIILLLTIIAIFAGFFDAIAGGGGLITLPALFLAGIDPVAAIATNKFQATSATVSATIVFLRKGMIKWKSGIPIGCMAALGSCLGALSISILSKSTLEAIVPVLLIIVAIYFSIAPKLDNEERKAKISAFTFSLFIVPTIGFYDGVFGPGVGSFFMLAFVLLLGQGILNAIAYTKLANASSNIGALIIFAINGNIIIPLALAMSLGAFLGAQLGARCAIKFGPKLIKPLLVSICLLMTIKLLNHPTNPLKISLIKYYHILLNPFSIVHTEKIISKTNTDKKTKFVPASLE